MKVSTDAQVALKSIQQAQKIGLVVPPNTGVDAASSALALYHLLLPLGKKVTVVVPDRIPKPVRSLPSSTVIRSDFGPKNLVVTLDTNETPIEKVSYKSEGSKFKLIIHPRGRSFSVENIHYDYQGLAFDLLIVLGATRLSDLGELFKENKNDFEGATVLNIDVNSQNEHFGQINVVDPSKSLISELLFNLLLSWKIVPSREAAQCLLAALAAGSSSTKLTEVPVEGGETHFTSPLPPP